MKTLKWTWPGLFLLVLLACLDLPTPAAAAPIIELTARYNVSLSVNAEIPGLRDGNGNHLNSVPSDLSIIAKTNSQTGSGFFSSLFGPNKPPEITESSVTGIGDVIVGGTPRGDGPSALSINDGLILKGTASGSIGSPLALRGKDLVSSDISQSGDVAFSNKSTSTTYFADILVMWNFDITAESQSHSPPDEGVVMDTGYVFDVARRTEGTAGTILFLRMVL